MSQVKKISLLSALSLVVNFQLGAGFFYPQVRLHRWVVGGFWDG